MAIFRNESEMQSWIKEEIDSGKNLSDLISNVKYIYEYELAEVTDGERRIYNSFKEVLDALNINCLIWENENISLNKKEILKPDFVLYSTETEGFVIVELKNFKGATREIGTEILAYSSEIKTYVPFLAEAEIFYVIISPEWPTLMRHFIFHEIYWGNKNIICLEPIKEKRKVKLRIKNIKEISESDFTLHISDKSLSGFQICLYDHELYKKGAKRERLDNYIYQMTAALQVMSVEGNKQKSHGFALLWKDTYSKSLAPYSITVLNMSPFSSVERFLHEDVDWSELPITLNKIINLIRTEDPTGHGRSLQKIANVGEIFLQNFCNPMPEGFTDWSNLKLMTIPRAEFISFVGWGSFGIRFNEKLISEYAAGNIATSNTSPELGLQVIAEIVDEHYDYIDIAGLHFVDEDPFE